MSNTDIKLKEAFAALSDNAIPTDSCPDPETLWSACRGELEPERVKEIVEHTVTCGACAESWRLTREMINTMPVEEKGTSVGSARVIPFPKWIAPVALMAAAVILGFVMINQKPAQPEPVFRQASTEKVRSLLPEQALDRQSCLLRWTLEPTVPNARYDIQVTTEDVFVSVVKANNLEQPSFLIDPGKLADLPEGTNLLWTVTVYPPEGEAFKSSTFSNPIR